MSKSKPESKEKSVKKGTKISAADSLTKAGKSGSAELDEADLKRVSGGSLNFTVKI